MENKNAWFACLDPKHDLSKQHFQERKIITFKNSDKKLIIGRVKGRLKYESMYYQVFQHGENKVFVKPYHNPITTKDLELFFNIKIVKPFELEKL